jgi:hypothetical protein
MNRALLQRALEQLDRLDEAGNPVNRVLISDLYDELEKSELVECGWIDTRHGILYNGWVTDNLGTGKYRLFAEIIDDEL